MKTWTAEEVKKYAVATEVWGEPVVTEMLKAFAARLKMDESAARDGDAWVDPEIRVPVFDTICLIAHRVGKKIVVSEGVRWGYKPGHHDDPDPKTHWQIAGSDDYEYPLVVAWMPMPTYLAPIPPQGDRHE